MPPPGMALPPSLREPNYDLAYMNAETHSAFHCVSHETPFVTDLFAPRLHSTLLVESVRGRMVREF